MSKKPIKKSDEGKNWISKRRDRAIKSKLEYHLIICEGTKTEPNYFTAMKQDIGGDNKDKISIEVIGEGRGTTNLLEKAIKLVRNSPNYISYAWIVYDKDDFSEESFNQVTQKCEVMNRKEETKFYPIWSNESIEVWFLLHFNKIDSKIGRKDCIKKLNENFKQHNIGTYRKNDEELYEKLKPYIYTAIQNAKWLEGRYDAKLTPAEMNPCTRVYKLVELLTKFM